MGQQLVRHAGTLRWQPRQHIFQVRVRITPIELGTLDETHDRSAALARTQRTGKQPVVAPDGNRPDLVLDMVVIHRQLPIGDETRKRLPASEAVIQRLGRARAIRDHLAVQNHPLLPTNYFSCGCR